jgi:hypothetical protein
MFSGLASGDRLLDRWNIDVVSGRLAIEPCQAITVDVTLVASVCKGDSTALADQTLDLRSTRSSTDSTIQRLGRGNPVESGGTFA